MSKDRNRRKDDLLAAARGRLEQGEESQSARRRPAAEEPAGREIMYRGQVMRQGSAGTPGSGIGRSKSASGGGDDDIRAALQKIKQLYSEGLISRAEAEEKRSKILDRL